MSKYCTEKSFTHVRISTAPIHMHSPLETNDVDREVEAKNSSDE